MLTILILLIIALVVFKYHIDTKLTIAELKKDRDQFRSHAWRLIRESDKQRNDLEVSRSPYHDLKQKINQLSKDLSETDFESFDNIKDEIINALTEIDSYGESIDKS